MDVHQLTAAYALDALDTDERDVYEAHLAQCEDCRHELSTLGETAAALAWAVDAPAPPPRLRSRILEAAAGERENVVSFPVRRAWVVRTTAAVAAVAACTAIGLGIWSAKLSHSLDAERSARSVDAGAAQILADPAATKTTLRGTSGMVAVDSTGRGVLVVHRLPAAPGDKTYEAWVIPPGGKPIPAGTFRGGGAMTMVPLREAVPIGSVVATTVEREGGVERPTQTPIFSAQT
ncbi:MAG: hypothetical protein QOF43_2232 [Gaiellaceae bacterium]|nr:hypothetical protein [Gaiellaceae bacterium]